MSSRRRWRPRLPRSLFWRLSAFAGLLYLVTCAASWVALQEAIEGPAEAVVDTRVLALARELRGYWASAEITGVAPYGPGDVELVWQISAEDGTLFRSDLLYFEDIVLAEPEGLTVSFDTFDIETPIGWLHVVARKIVETVPAAPDATNPGNKAVTYWAAITEERRQSIMDEHRAPFERAALQIFVVLALLLFAVLLFLGLLLRLPLSRLRRAAARFRAGETSRLEGRYPSEIATVVESLNAALARSETLVARTRRYIGKIGHDLKHPLAIVGNALERPEEHDTARRRLEGMAALLDRYTTLATAVGPGSPTRAVVLRPLLEEARDGIALLYRRTPLVIDVECPHDIELHVARQDLEAMTTNLLTNAFRHAAGRVVMRAEAGDPIVLSVEDDGPGLNEGEMRKALHWGERLDGAPPGSGFGLAIVKDLVELHGGRISLAPSELGGLRASLELPLTG